MAYQKLQGIRAITVFPADDVPVPNPASLKISSSNTGVVALELVDASANFVDLNVLAGDVVYNTTTSTATVVVRVVSNTNIILQDDIFLASPNAYKIYSPALDGPVLYVGGSGDLNVVTAGGDEVLFVNVQNGAFFPVMVKEVKSSGTNALDIVALF